jgi:hypothetical protein
MAPLLGPVELLELEDDRHLAKLVSDWDFRRGKEFENAIFTRYKTSVHHPSSSPEGVFYLLAVFRRYTELPRLHSYAKSNKVSVAQYCNNMDVHHNFHTPLSQQAAQELDTLNQIILQAQES